MKRTKIVCTIGPASEAPEKLAALSEAGMNVARLNFSHGDHEEHLARINTIKKIRKETGRVIAILLDTKGPEIRTHDMENGAIEFKTGDVVRISMTEVLGTKEKFSITYPELINDVKRGSIILVDDGLVGLAVTEVDHANGEIVCVVNNSGVVKNKKESTFLALKQTYLVLLKKTVRILSSVSKTTSTISQQVSFVVLQTFKKFVNY